MMNEINERHIKIRSAPSFLFLLIVKEKIKLNAPNTAKNGILVKRNLANDRLNIAGGINTIPNIKRANRNW
jgi:hypothetical protein